MQGWIERNLRFRASTGDTPHRAGIRYNVVAGGGREDGGSIVDSIDRLLHRAGVSWKLDSVDIMVGGDVVGAAVLLKPVEMRVVAYATGGSVDVLGERLAGAVAIADTLRRVIESSARATVKLGDIVFDVKSAVSKPYDDGPWMLVDAGDRLLGVSLRVEAINPYGKTLDIFTRKGYIVEYHMASNPLVAGTWIARLFIQTPFKSSDVTVDSAPRIVWRIVRDIINVSSPMYNRPPHGSLIDTIADSAQDLEDGDHPEVPVDQYRL